MDFRYQNAARKLGTRDISSTSSSSEGSTTFVPDSKEGTYSPLPAFAEQAINQLNLAEKEHEHSQEDGDSDQNMEMDTDHEKDTEPDDVATSHEGGANPSLIGSDQKHKRPVQAMTKSWPQHSSVQPDTSGGDGADSQIFFASRVSFWAMVAAHGLPSTCGPPEGMFELGEEMGGAWSCRRCMYLDGEVWFVAQLRSCPRCVFPLEPYKRMELMAGDPFGCFRQSSSGAGNPAWWRKHWKNS